MIDRVMLCFDTSTDTLVVALVDVASGALVHGSAATGVRAQALLDRVDEALRDVGLNRGAIAVVAVGIGPGAFTGLRIGVTTARGIGAALGVPLRGVPSLLAVGAQEAMATPGAEVIAEIDARRGERFAQAIIAGDHGPMAIDVPVALGHGGLVPFAAGRAVVAGPASPTSLAAAAMSIVDADPMSVYPTYGREPDAVPSPGGS